jgi:hypothetical protein
MAAAAISDEVAGLLLWRGVGSGLLAWDRTCAQSSGPPTRTCGTSGFERPQDWASLGA